ncbi:MAG: FHA domain-containing protein [Anaerolineae bacterium]|nr:MAG: FHA domain-containing protein [Anaerolineae bacterium]
MVQKGDKPMIQTLFNEFVELRRSGRSSEEAWQQILEKSKMLSKSDRQQLAVMAQQWEYKQRSARPGEDTIDTFDTLNRPSSARPAHQEDKASNTDVSDIGEGVPAGLEPRHFFGAGTVLLLYPQNVDKPLSVTIDVGDEALIGRLAPNTILVPHIDLEPFGGLAAGVSRVHASLKHQANALLVADMGSRNGTYINGHRLHEKELRLLQDGDELRVGQLNLIVRFMRPVR